VPFTGAHPLAVLPLLRTGLPPSALVVGSVVPDLPLFLPFRTPFDAVVRTHTPLGLLTLDLPAGLLVWFLWHALLAPAAWSAAPAGLRGRLAPGARPGLRRRLRWRALPAVAAAVVAGAATHVLWDEFTHHSRWGERHVPVLAATAGGLPGWQWAQYASGVLGLALLALWLALWWRRTPAAPDADHAPAPAWPWLVITGACVAAAVVAAARTGPPLRDAAVAAAVRGIGSGALVALLLAVGHLVRKRLTATSAERPTSVGPVR
jgi:hypothetical protein